MRKKAEVSLIWKPEKSKCTCKVNVKERYKILGVFFFEVNSKLRIILTFLNIQHKKVAEKDNNIFKGTLEFSPTQTIYKTKCKWKI